MRPGSGIVRRRYRKRRNTQSRNPPDEIDRRTYLRRSKERAGNYRRATRTRGSRNRKWVRRSFSSPSVSLPRKWNATMNAIVELIPIALQKTKEGKLEWEALSRG